MVSSEDNHQVAIVTGAGGYLGLAICKRLMDETDPNIRLTIVVTSRHYRGAVNAVRELQDYNLKNHLERPSLIEFDYLLFDQCDMVSMLGAAREICRRWARIDYVFFNSSYSQLGGIDYWQATKDFFQSPLKAFTIGTFKIQGLDRKSQDGMGSSFQANVLSPWYLVKEIMPSLGPGSKLIYISTSISLPEYFNPEDLGIEKSHHSYEASKYELELLHQATYKELYEKHGIQSWLLQPGVFKSTTFVPTLSIFAYVGMLLMFYICRWCGSPYHCIYPELAANAPLFLALKADPARDDMAIKYGSSTDRWGHEKLLRSRVSYDPSYVQLLYKYVEGLRLEWVSRLKDQIIERRNY